MRFDFEAWIERYRLTAVQGGALVALAFWGDARFERLLQWKIDGATWGEQTLKALVRRHYAVETTPILVQISPVGRAAIETLETGSPGVLALRAMLHAAPRRRSSQGKQR